MNTRQISGTKTRAGSVALWLCALGLGALLAPQSLVAHAQQGTATDAACALEKGVYQCDWLAFKSAFNAAKTVSVQSEAQDVHSDDSLRKLANHLGKNVVPRTDQPADLTFLMVPLNKNGIYIGPGEENLGTLRIYSGRTVSEPGTLVWAETYRGTKDVPWPSVEFYLMQQFKARLKS
ncbi:hypothetical protein [Granulicella paludicola]|uniref:hypothetical protein n=1 Tax=Granulicella paludicola TaxID=474951 RepID=UPI0021E068EE|nr:hypothetical protein [Granulicella paludicola]